ncbi:ISL3 family transposase [Bacillus sp. SD088]|uniref:ISL3 family transposase n=1 Tax=Bacillus sp. SD088 TaxID=2782012 RepID=UPI001A9714D4|nr:ISL3 family transposase [Bacillus sp. SD088]MBO0994842.1 ISL3 family transposase [Bacillus sp. SD088]
MKHLPFVGIDDFAFKKRMTYGTIFVDLITKKPIDLLKTRKQEDVTEWLKSHSNIALITRDGSKSYAKAITEASSSITQVGDRWHILHQLFEAIKKTITSIVPLKWKPPNPELSASKKATPIVPARKDETRRIQNEEKRWERIQQVQRLYEQGYSVTAIQKKCQISRGTVYKDLRQKGKPSNKRGSPYQKYRPLIHSLLLKEQSNTNHQIEKVCRSKGYTGSLSTLNAMIAEERRNAKNLEPKSYYFRQKIIKIIWDFEKNNHIECLRQLHPKLLEVFPELKVIDELVGSFRNLFSEKSIESLEYWMNHYNESDLSHVKSFINGLRQDLQAVKLSVQEEWNNGITEGHVNRLKMIKRIMYGRAGFSVLKNRVLYQI